MAKFRYTMVFLPKCVPDSFLLFVDNQGSKKLRDYSSGSEYVVGQPSVESVFSETVPGKTQFEVDAHTVTDDTYWYKMTKSFNETYLTSLNPLSGEAIVRDIPLSNKELSHEVLISDDFSQWNEQWKEKMEFTGAHLPDPEGRIKQVLDLWNAPVPKGWERGSDPQLLKARYRRGNIDNLRGEKKIEHDILEKHFEQVEFLECELVDGINAMPLTRDAKGGRHNNVEADLLLLLKKSGRYTIVICELKEKYKNSWYAIIENIRQLKLLELSSSARDLFRKRNPSLSLSEEIPVMGCVVAPREFYDQAGQKANAKPHAERLIKQFYSMTGLSVCLAVWDLKTRKVTAIASGGDSIV
ncbi:MAG: hypothetical protein H7839_18100 [Magnetococcus sp. YQC-5]